MIDLIVALFDGSLIVGGIFLLIGIIGAVLLLISLLLDGVFDFFDFGDGPLSLTTIAAFATIFGFASFGFVGAGLSTQMAALFGAGAGVIGGAVSWWLARTLRDDTSNTAVSTSTLVGAIAHVILAIPGGSRVGEISLSRHGERLSLTATATEAIARGEQVRIIATLTPTSVVVERHQPAEEPV